MKISISLKPAPKNLAILWKHYSALHILKNQK